MTKQVQQGQSHEHPQEGWDARHATTASGNILHVIREIERHADSSTQFRFTMTARAARQIKEGMNLAIGLTSLANADLQLIQQRCLHHVLELIHVIQECDQQTTQLLMPVQ